MSIDSNNGGVIGIKLACLFRIGLGYFGLICSTSMAGAAEPSDLPQGTVGFVNQYCADCHDRHTLEGGLDLTALKFKLTDPDNFATWIKVYDRASTGMMPPAEEPRPAPTDLAAFTTVVAESLSAFELEQTARNGRAPRRRLNRDEYQNVVRDLLDAPWLQLKSRLPEDPIAHHYTKSGDSLDMSHVQLGRYIDVADYALREVMAKQINRPQTTVKRYYARAQPTFVRNTWKHTNEQERTVIPVNGYESQYELFGQDASKFTVGESDPAIREIEGFVEVASQVNNYLMWFDQFSAPVAGRYKIRLNAFSAWIGPSSREPGMPHQWWIPDLANVMPSTRTEPVTVYAETYPRKYRLMGKFDAQTEPSVHEMEVWLLKSETIHPDASRLFRSRQGASRFRNPLATKDGSPGVGFRWLEVEGPLIEQWPSAGHRLLFGDLPLESVAASDDTPTGNKSVSRVDVVSRSPEVDAERLLRRFLMRAYRHPSTEDDVKRFLAVARGVWQSGGSFADAMVTAYTAALSSPQFLTLPADPGPLDGYALAERLSFFLQNTAPDQELRSLAADGRLCDPQVLRAATDRLLDSPKSAQFIEHFTDYWLDLRKVSEVSPDPVMYSDYYLDDLLSESSLEETRAFVTELVRHNLPVRNLIDSDFVTINEKLAELYGLPGVEGVGIRRVPVPAESPRGGLLTQASVLKITTNGNVTSPVTRGAWILDRILGRPPSPPPPSVPAVEADTRGATTIREQLRLHRNSATCAACHRDIDPPGFALESFDVAGGWRERYRGVDANVLAEVGVGHVGQKFEFHYALPVDSTGEMSNGTRFTGIRDFKQILLRDEAQLARNVASQLVVYATGTPVRFSDRALIEQVIHRSRASEYGFRTLIHGVVQSPLFRNK